MTDETGKVPRHQTAPDELQVSEIRYRRLFESARDGILILDAVSRRITDANPFMVELLGYSRDEFLGKELWEIGLFKDKDESQAAFRELQGVGYIRYEDLPLQTKAGKPWHVEFISNVYHEAGRSVIQCNIRDITERRKAEERLKQSEQWLRKIFETSHEGILVEENERIHYVNKSYLQLFGYDDAEELIGRHISVVISPEDVERLLGYGKSRLRGEHPPSEYEFKGRRKDGSTVEVEASASASHVEGCIYITTMIRDITGRKRAEAALRDAQERLLQAMDAAKMFSWEMNPKTQQFSFSQNVERAMGFTFPKEIINNPIGNHLHPDDAEQAIRKTLHAVETGEPYEDTMRMINPHTGEIVWMHSQGILAKNADGEPRFVGIAQNITERKQAEETKFFLASIVESSEDSMITVNFDGVITSWNRAAETLYGYSANEAIGKPLTQLALPENVKALLANIEIIKHNQAVETFDTVRIHKDGRYLNLEIVLSPVKDAAGRVIGVSTVARDITARKLVEEALRESETRFRAMFEQANVGIVQASSQGRLLVVNPGFCKIVGYPEAEARGMMIRDLTHRDDYEEEEELTRQLMAGEISGYTLEKRYLHKDGRLVWGQMTATLVRRASGEPYYMLAIVEDISERKRAEEALVRLNEQLEQRVAERTVELMGMNASLQAEIAERRRAERERASILRRLVMAQEEERRRIARDLHDQFGQQLTVLMLKLGMLKEDCGEQKGLCEQVENLEEVASRLDADVDFLVWELRPTVLDDLGLQDALTNFAQNWSKHFGIPVEVLTHGLGKQASTSEIDTVLYRIAQEALNNVAKHARAASVTVLLEGRAGAVSLIIEDDGVGFDAENTSGANAKGLGLVGMRERAALVGGTTEIESHPRGGTRVIVRIPAPPAAEKGEAHD